MKMMSEGGVVCYIRMDNNRSSLCPLAIEVALLLGGHIKLRVHVISC